MAERKTYTEEQKAEILKKAEETSVMAASKEYGVSRAAIIKWRDSAKAEKAVEKGKAKAAKAKKDVKAAAKKADRAVKKSAAKAAEKISDEIVVTEIEAKKAAGKVSRKAKQAKASVKAAVEEAKKPRAARKAPKAEIIIQSPLGGNITPEEVLAKVGPADQIYIRVDENKAYWVRGEESGSVDLW